MDSDQVEGICIESRPSIEMKSDVAPCTPMLPIHRQKPQSHGTPESLGRLPPLFLGIGSSERQKKVFLESGNQLSPAPIVTYMSNSKPFCLQQLPARPDQPAASMPSKNLQRIQLEVQREGPELHKENLLSLSLRKHEMQLPVLQSSEPVLALGQYVRQAPPQRVLASLGTCNPSFAEVITSFEAHLPQSSSGSNLVANFCPLQLMKPVNARSKAYRGPAFADASDSKQLSRLAKPLTVCTPIVREETFQCIAQGNSEMTCISTSMDTWKLCHGVSRSCTARTTCTALCLPVEHSLCLSNGMQTECVKYRQLLTGAPDVFAQEQQTANNKGDNFVDSYGSGNSFKRGDSLPQKDSTSWGSQEHHEPDVFLADCPSDSKELRNLKRKKTISLEHLGPSACAREATDQCAQLYAKSQKSEDWLPAFSEQRKLCAEDNECKNSGVSTWRESTEKNGENKGTALGEWVAPQLPPFGANEQQNCLGLAASPPIVRLNGSSPNDSDIMRHLGRASSDLAGKFNAQLDGLKLFATPAYAQMPKALSTFSAGEPSLPLSLEVSGKLQDARAGKTPVNLGSTTDADWGKFLALSATPMGNKAETGADNIMPSQQRFRQLQAFLKQCDESDQRECLQALRSLSAAARSCHAVELETRAIRLSVYEGQEMKRMKLLNVLGKIPDRSLENVGATPQGPRLPAPGAASEYKQSS